jgi:hypothetical protein
MHLERIVNSVTDKLVIAEVQALVQKDETHLKSASMPKGLRDRVMSSKYFNPLDQVLSATFFWTSVATAS